MTYDPTGLIARAARPRRPNPDPPTTPTETRRQLRKLLAARWRAEHPDEHPTPATPPPWVADLPDLVE